MSKSLGDLFSRWESGVATVTKQRTAKRKSVKAQRKAAAIASTSAGEHTCFLYGVDQETGQPLSGYIAKCAVCMHIDATLPAVEAWAPPVQFDIWCKSRFGVQFKTPNAALDADRSDIVVAYNRYVRTVFDAPFSRSLFDRIVRREYAKQIAGLGDLGLLGYSADDIVDIAVFYAWAERVKSYVRGIGADDETAAHISQALRDIRSDEELQAVAQLEADGRYAFGADGRLRKQANSLAVRHARERLALRAELRESGLLDGFSYAPTAGEVYRQVNHVFREGMREWRNAMEGLTSEGVLPESIEALADTPLGVGSVVSAEASYFTVDVIDEVELTRQAWLDAYRAKRDAHQLVPAEGVALAVVEALTEGFKLYEIREHFSSERAFRSAVADAQQLFVAA